MTNSGRRCVVAYGGRSNVFGRGEVPIFAMTGASVPQECEDRNNLREYHPPETAIAGPCCSRHSV